MIGVADFDVALHDCFTADAPDAPQVLGLTDYRHNQ